ncbi:phosphoribosylglycinamide formyltransferase [Sodiomyces alkalinus F11]|uniref:Phosphoribosylglycinamide formyltransferase n=1 Tax=Sodiomyces alkalinus (strain CBS 110278 / VKM F-3762 / F11) TaxID=1314773 RepID=A0A3N2PR42_SODAK|nr:phosphoribosylglycinamide formyltransferase [Sodiomyces alkalinus F11]ROT36982.1 phosphoribosylglycinamide formyltransferase [Sodiomyces alkalinus F11]
MSNPDVSSAGTGADADAECRLTVLCSGNGTNLQALIDAVASGEIPRSRITKVFINRKTAYAATRAHQAGIPSEYFNLVSGGFQQKGEKDEAKLRESRARYDAALAQKVLQDKPDLIVLAGWMHVFGEPFLTPVGAAGVPVINLHPALPGKYDGANAIERAYQDFQSGKLENNHTGIMIHYVTIEVDRGEPIMTQTVECRQGDSLDDLENRIHAAEHGLLVRATAKVVGDVLSKKSSS